MALSVRAKALVFEDPKSVALLSRVREIAPRSVSVLISGETVGMVMILFGNRMDVSGDARRFLDIVLGPIGFALIRDRFLEATRAAS